MKESRSQYISDETEQPSNSNSNGNGNGKIFELKRTTDPDTLAVLSARDIMLADARLNRSMRAFGCFLIDRALNPRFFDCKGVVCLADSIPAGIFGVTTRTIYDWKNRIEECGYFWLSKKSKPNMWPLTVYHMTCLHRPREDRKTDEDGTYGGSKMRSAPNDAKAEAGRLKRNAALATKRAQKSLPLQGGIAVVLGSSESAGPVESAVLKGISAQSRKKLRPSAEMNFGPEPKPISARSRNEFRPGAEMNFGPEPKPISAQSRKTVRPPAEASCRHIEAETVNPEHESVLRTVNRINRAGAAEEGEEKALDAGHNWHNEDSENDFLALCREVMGRFEIDDKPGGKKGNGGLWRLNFRQDKHRAWAVMREARMKKREGFQPQTTWAQVCMDLWIHHRV